MKNLTVLFVLALLTSTVQSQSLTEKEITGTWQVINVVDAGSKPKQAKEMVAAYFDIYSDHTFQLRMKKEDKQGLENKFKNSSWSYNETTQTITINKDNTIIKPSKNNGKMIFELPESGMKLEVVMPI